MSTPKTINLICKQCSLTFDKNKREYDRWIRNGRTSLDFFCSRSCASKWGNINASPTLKQHRTENMLKTQHKATKIAQNANYKGRFTYYLKKIKERTKRKKNWDDSDITEHYLQYLWNNQNGKCAWTGKDMIITSYNNNNPGMYAASLDRIDSNIGYIQGNVQFVLLPLNLAKKSYSDIEFRTFLYEVFSKPL